VILSTWAGSRHAGRTTANVVLCVVEAYSSLYRHIPRSATSQGETVGTSDGTPQTGLVGPTPDAVVSATWYTAETCPACRSTQTVAVVVDAVPLYNLCDGCNHRWHRWPMSGKFEHLRKAAQVELDALNPTGVTST
jgi:hypothetical protein